MKLKVKYNIKHLLYLLLLLALPLVSMADDNNALFQQGNKAYAKEQFQTSINSYQKIIYGGYQSAAVYFNLGNAYYKLGDIPSALLYYEKAHKLVPGDEDINFNIRFANSKTSDKVEADPEFFVTRWWHSFIMYYTVNTLAAISIPLIFAGFLVLILYLFTNSFFIKRSSFFAGLILIFFGLFTVFIANRQSAYFDSHHGAIIFNGAVTVEASPEANAKALFIVHEGTKVTVRQNTGEWLEVELPNGNAGWISATDAKEI